MNNQLSLSNNSRYKIKSTELENKATQFNVNKFFKASYTFLVDYSVTSNQARQKTGIFY